MKSAPVVPEGPRPSVVLIDDEEALLRMLSALLTKGGCDVRTYSDADAGLAAAARPDVDVVLVDLNMPGKSGMEVLSALKAGPALAEVILITGAGSIPSVLEAVRRGAYDYLTKPFTDVGDVVARVKRAADRKRLVARNRELETLVRDAQLHSDFVGESQKMKDVFALIEQVAASPTTVLIQGESGTGKELVARSIHKKSARASRPFVAINCAAMTETLLESELFGHVRGAFTGAVGAKKGLIETAQRGTLFLDEIGDMPPATQVKLLRVLQQGEVRPVGSTDVVQVDVRFIAATHVGLQEAVAAGKFREDLFYRLNVIAITLPPLRERTNDIPLLAHHFLSHYSQKLKKQVTRISDDALQMLLAHAWPGNVRELENVIERAAVLVRGHVLEVSDLPAALAPQARREEATALLHMKYADARKATLGAFDRQYLMAMMKAANDNITVAAQKAGLDRSNFRRLLKAHGLAPNRAPGGTAGAEDDDSDEGG